MRISKGRLPRVLLDWTARLIILRGLDSAKVRPSHSPSCLRLDLSPVADLSESVASPANVWRFLTSLSRSSS